VISKCDILCFLHFKSDVTARLHRGGTTGMATMAMAIALSGIVYSMHCPGVARTVQDIHGAPAGMGPWQGALLALDTAKIGKCCMLQFI